MWGVRPGSEGFLNDAPAAVDSDSTAATKESLIALLKSLKNLMRALLAEVTKKVQTQTNIDFSSTSAQTIIAAPGAGYCIRITQLIIGSGSNPPINVEVVIKYGTRTVKTLVCSAIVLDFSEHENLNENEALVMQATTADRIAGGVSYYVEAV